MHFAYSYIRRLIWGSYWACMDFERTSSGGQFVDMAASKHAHRQQRICGYGCGELHSIVQSGSIWLELAMKFRARDVRGLWAARHMLVNHCMSSKWERKSPKPNKFSSYTTKKYAQLRWMTELKILCGDIYFFCESDQGVSHTTPGAAFPGLQHLGGL